MAKNTMSSNELDEYRFMGLIEMLTQSAMMALGKLAHPQTGETQLDLAQAQGMIDLLTVLESRTKGNLSQRESAFLSTQLTNLRLNFLDEVRKPGAAAAAAHDDDDEDEDDEDDEDEDDDDGDEDSEDAASSAPSGSSDEKKSTDTPPSGFVDRRSSKT